MNTKEAVINTKETALLAKLSFTEEELSSFEHDMSAVVRFAENISGVSVNESVKTDGIHPSALRSDFIKVKSNKDELLGAAPADSIEEGCFTVPRVVE